MKRRDFVATVGAGVWGLGSVATRSSSFPSVQPRAPSRLSPLGVQLYTLRNAMHQDVDGTIARIAQIGYREIEWWGEYGRTPQQLRRLLDRHHLRSPSAHVGLEALEGDAFAATVARARVMGHQYIVVASVDDALVRTLDGWRRVADRFDTAARRLHREGLQFAYHNHDVEFRELQGQRPMDVLCEHTDPRLVQIEMDLYWIIDAGGDPVAFFRRWPHRVPLVHVKDRTADGRMVDVGAGAIDWRAIFAHRAEAGIRHYFVEHDEPADPFASIAASYRYLSTLDV